MQLERNEEKGELELFIYGIQPFYMDTFKIVFTSIYLYVRKVT